MHASHPTPRFTLFTSAVFRWILGHCVLSPQGLHARCVRRHAESADVAPRLTRLCSLIPFNFAVCTTELGEAALQQVSVMRCVRIRTHVYCQFAGCVSSAELIPSPRHTPLVVLHVQAEFDKRGVKMLALSCDTVEDHKGWIADIRAARGGDVRTKIAARAGRAARLLFFRTASTPCRSSIPSLQTLTAPSPCS